MILGAMQYAATYPVTPKEFRPFIRSSVGLWSRAERCARAWAPHEENCKAFILDKIAGMKQRRTAVVLGSGLLRDVPAAALASAFDTVVLVDLVHLASVRIWLSTKRLSNMRLIWRDLSGLETTLAGKVPEPLAFLRQVPYLDLVVSANILSQIAVGAKRSPELANNPSKDDILRAMIKGHIDGMAGLPCKTALITDIGYRVRDRNGTILEEDDLLCGLPPPPANASWTWPVAPFGEIDRNCEAVHEVIAL